jgi:cell division protein FtsB
MPLSWKSAGICSQQVGFPTHSLVYVTQANDCACLADSWPRDEFRGKRDPSTMPRLTLVLERVLPLAILVVAVVGAPVMIFSPEGLPRLRGLERELAQVQDETTELGREIESLRGRVERLRDDPTAVERIARDNLGMLRQTEVVFQFPAAR